MLEQIKTRKDLLDLTPQEDAVLCSEIREFLVQNLSQTGGHLASNLGVVELTVALHKVYDTEKDRLLFDVGHQSYVHKMLTGRREKFDTLRTFGGLAGFPKPSESVHDPFIAGHASDSVSVALGMARARTLRKEDYDVVVVLGDGALTGGLAYEGLNDAGASGEPMVVVLNDNGMSINDNVGAVAKHLSSARLKPKYFKLKKSYRRIVNRLPGGKKFYLFSSKLKDKLRRKLLGVTLFEEMGFNYLGPVDGHDVDNLVFLLSQAKDMNEPVLLHVITKKGKGFRPAEKEPSAFHGVGKFDPDTGSSAKAAGVSFSETFGQTMCRLAAIDPRVCAVTAAMESGTGLSGFAKEFPERFFDVGIAEGHAVSMAAGLAMQGMIPVFAVYSTFLQRSYDMLIHDVALSGVHAVFAVDRAGLVGADGETHHGAFDVGFLRQVPGMQVFCPANRAELRRMMDEAVLRLDGPVAVRYPKGEDGKYQDERWEDRICANSNLTIVTYGITVNHVIAAAEQLKAEGICADVIKLDCIAPLCAENVAASVQNTGRLLIVEETADVGCVADALVCMICARKIPFSYRKLNLAGGILPHGSTSVLLHAAKLDPEGIYQSAKELLYER